VQGSWNEPYKHKRDWHGVARSPHPLVALTLVATKSHVEWVKSDPEERNELDIRLGMFSYDAEELDVEVSFSVGGGQRRCRSLVPSFDLKPDKSCACRLSMERLVLMSGLPLEARCHSGQKTNMAQNEKPLSF
jgi:hypothetical protein